MYANVNVWRTASLVLQIERKCSGLPNAGQRAECSPFNCDLLHRHRIGHRVRACTVMRRVNRSDLVDLRLQVDGGDRHLAIGLLLRRQVPGPERGGSRAIPLDG